MKRHSWEDRKRPAISKDLFGGFAKKQRAEKFRLRKPSQSKPQRYNDEIHHSIDICPMMQELMDSWPMQRLRDIKQLGTAFLVYGCANHTRFEHSVGVAHLSRELCSRLQRQHDLGVSNKDVLCVTLAGLLHDVGHGPFSHLYETFRESVEKDLHKDSAMMKMYEEKFPPLPQGGWAHERSSLLMVDAALESIGLKIDMREDYLDQPLMQIGDGVDANLMKCYWGEKDDSGEVMTNRDWIFIKECIYGEPIPEVVEHFGYRERMGRTKPEQEWLYDIVSNRHNGIDVDKVDYFARDERRTMAEAGKVNISIINEACVARAKCSESNCETCRKGGLHYMICYPKKCVERLIEFFRFRGRMHEVVYKHKTSVASACMVVDILKKADPHYRITTDDGTQFPLSRAFMDKHAFDRLRDTVIESIAASKEPELEPARKLAIRFQRRELYKVASQRVIHMNNRKEKDFWMRASDSPEDIVREICSVDGKHTDMFGNDVVLTEDDVIVECHSWHQGKGDNNPVSFVRFVERHNASWSNGNQCPKAYQIGDEDHGLSTSCEFKKRAVYVFCRVPLKTELLYHKFEAYWDMYVSSTIRVPNSSPAPAVNYKYGGLELDEEASSDSNDDDQQDPVPLTQESGDEGDLLSPMKRHNREYYSSPQPILKLQR